jgi:hypothetical protein
VNLLSRSLLALASAVAASLPAFVAAQPLLTGFLCCNMRSDPQGWIADINYDESHKHLVPVGTPAVMTGYGRSRFEFDVTGDLKRKNYWIGNDYSRGLSMEPFAARYIVKDDPNQKMKSFSPKIRNAIKAQKVVIGMTREQVLMSLSYPVESENKDIKSNVWNYYLSSFAPFKVRFEGDRVVKVDTDPETLEKVFTK